MWYRWGMLVVLMVGVLLHRPTGVYGQQADLTQLIKDYYSAENSGDFDKAFAFYADNAVVKNPLGLFVGKEQIGTWLRQDVQTTRVAPQDFQVMNGNTVISTGMVTLERFQKAGIDQVQYRAEYLIENGKIRFFSPMVTLTPEQQDKMRAATPPPAPPTIDPIQVVKDYYSAENSGDFDKAFAFYADGAVVKNPLGLFVGKEQIGTWLRQDVQTTRATPQDFQVMNGNTVISTGMVTLERFQKAGIDQVQYRAEYLVEGDKIKYFSPMVMLTPEQQEQMRAASAGAAGAGTPAMLPNTGAATSGYSWLAGLALLLIASGLALMTRRRLHRM